MTLPEPYYDRDGITIYVGDCRDVLPHIGPVHAVVTDPPYGLEFMGMGWDRPWAVSHSSKVGIEGKNMTLPSHRDNRNANCKRCGGRQRGAKRCSCDKPLWDRDPAEDMRQYQAWFTGIAELIKDAMLPGAHLLAFGGTRTYHRMAVAIEDAGYEIRDSMLYWGFGQGFPKSHNVNKALESKGLACKCGGSSDAHGEDGGLQPDAHGSGASHRPRPTEQQSEQPRTMAEQPGAQAGGAWPLCRRCNLPVVPQGLGTALKPAYEPIIMARKQLKGTVAANVLQHGTGAINVDACRIPSDGSHMVRGTVTKRTTVSGDERTGKALGMYGAGASFTPTNHEGGRWPANVILDEGSARALDAQSGVSKSGVAVRRNGNNGKGMFPVKIASRSADVGFGDTGGASRYFKVVAQDAECLVCAREYGPKHGIMRATERVAPCDHASSAETSSPLTDQDSDSAHDPAPARLPLENGGSSQSSNGRASTAVSSSGSTQPTRTPIAVDDALGSLVESLVPRVMSAASLCDSCVTAIAQSLAATLLGQTPESHHGLDSIPGSNASILIRNLASYAEPMVNTGIIPTTASLSTLFGSVRHAMSQPIPASDTVNESGLSRLKYCPKASRRERNAGLDKPAPKVQLRDDLTPEQRAWVLDQLAASGVSI